jgi:hypothetical protein
VARSWPTEVGLAHGPCGRVAGTIAETAAVVTTIAFWT